MENNAMLSYKEDVAARNIFVKDAANGLHSMNISEMSDLINVGLRVDCGS